MYLKLSQALMSPVSNISWAKIVPGCQDYVYRDSWLQGMRDALPALPAGIAVAGEQLRALALPAAVVHIAGHLWRLRLIRRKRRRKPARAAAASQGKLSYPGTQPP